MLVDILFWIAAKLLFLFKWAVILSAIMSMLVSFNVLDTRNRFVWMIGDFLFRITEPAMRRVRRVLPNFGSIDLSPAVLIVGIIVAEMLLAGLHRAVRTGNFSNLIW